MILPSKWSFMNSKLAFFGFSASYLFRILLNGQTINSSLGGDVSNQARIIKAFYRQTKFFNKRLNI